MFKEITQSDKIYYTANTGKVFIVEIEEKGRFLLPNKKGMSLKGEKQIIHKGEAFTYLKHEELNIKKRIIRLQFIRNINNKTFYLSENDLIYFSVIRN